MDEFIDLVEKLQLPKNDFVHLDELRKKILNVDVRNKDSVNELGAELDKIDDTTTYISYSYKIPILFFLRSHYHHIVAEHYLNHDYSQSSKDISKAAEKSRVSNQEWNESLAHSYLGLLYYKMGDLEHCCIELHVALYLLVNIERDYSETGQYDKLQKVTEHINKVIGHIKKAKCAPSHIQST